MIRSTTFWPGSPSLAATRRYGAVENPCLFGCCAGTKLAGPLHPAANEIDRIEVRPHWPAGASCATPPAAIDGEPGQKLELVVSYHADRKHLPVIKLKRVA